MSRKGRNLNLKEYQFTTDRDEPLTAKFTLRVTLKMLSELEAIENWWELVKDAIADKLKQENAEGRQDGK